MKFTLSAALFATAGLVSALDCPEAARFGGLSVVPKTVTVGGNFTLTNNLTCAPVKGIHPRFIDYFLGVPSNVNNGHQPLIYLGRSTFNTSRPTPDVDILIGKIPASPTITSFPNSTQYEITSTVIYPVNITDPNSALIAGQPGGVGITINSS